MKRRLPAWVAHARPRRLAGDRGGPVSDNRGGYSGSRPGAEMGPPKPIPSGYTVRNADWLAGYAAGKRAAEREQAQRERDYPAPVCQRVGCERRALLDHAHRFCREHREDR